MSSRLRSNLHYLNLLLDSHKPQQKALLLTASNDQLDFISELIHNILFVVPITDKSRKALHRRKYLLEIANIKRSHNYRRQRVKRKALAILDLINEYQRELRSVARQ